MHCLLRGGCFSLQLAHEVPEVKHAALVTHRAPTWTMRSSGSRQCLTHLAESRHSVRAHCRKSEDMAEVGPKPLPVGFQNLRVSTELTSGCGGDQSFASWCRKGPDGSPLRCRSLPSLPPEQEVPLGCIFCDSTVFSSPLTAFLVLLSPFPNRYVHVSKRKT